MADQPLRDFVCANCFGSTGRVVSRTDEGFLYIRCDSCGDLSVIRDRRIAAMPGEYGRRADDPPAP
jgi:hypothetical protein